MKQQRYLALCQISRKSLIKIYPHLTLLISALKCKQTVKENCLTCNIFNPKSTFDPFSKYAEFVFKELARDDWSAKIH